MRIFTLGSYIIIIRSLLFALSILLFSCSVTEHSLDQTNDGKPASIEKNKRPNIIVIFADDLGYGDLQSYHPKGTPTPNIDSIGEQGFISRDFFIPANVCSPARASLLTGRYPTRAGTPMAQQSLAKKYIDSGYGLHPDERTIAEILKPVGYRSLMVGKWHLGFPFSGSHPLDAGFDEHFGIDGNYSNPAVDHPTYEYLKEQSTLYRGQEIIKERTQMEELTKRYTDEVLSFIEKEKERPFFIYFAHNIVHNPHLPREEFIGATENGPYGDFIHELDQSTGRILLKLQELGLEEDTLVVFTSDNGANFQGSNAPLNGGKYTTMEGGHIVPAMFRWPNVIPAGQDSEVTMTLMDLLPLFIHAADAELPTDRIIDGKNILPLLKGETGDSPHQVLYYYNGINLQAIRKGKWKLHLPRTVADQPFWHKSSAGTRVHTELEKPLLFNLEDDRGETRNLAEQHPEIVASFQADIWRARTELGDVDIIGTNQRVPPFEDIQNIDAWWR